VTLAPSGLPGKLASQMTKQDDARRKNLRRLLKDDADVVSVAANDLRWLLDEASRVQQSNDRLRRQNRRLRLRAGDDGLQGDAALDGDVDD
jgi:hypothetical protein